MIKGDKANLGRNILAIYNLHEKSGRSVLSGMLDAMSDICDWHLDIRQPGAEFSEKDVLGRNGCKYDGFIITMPGTPEAMKALAKSKLPTVLVNITDRLLSARTDAISFVWEDGADIGRRAARHLLERGDYKSVGYVHELQYEFYSYEREVAFRQTMKEAGLDSQTFPNDNDFNNYHSRLRAWLKALPKPAGVMAVSDMRAADIINACRDERLPVPEQVAVVGVDNDLAQHRKCKMEISSVLQDCHAMGQIATRELEFLFTHPKRQGRPHEILVPAKDVITRESSARSLSAVRLVRHAIDYIAANRMNNISRTDVIAHLGCSRQLAELRFQQITGRTIWATIEKVRMEEADMRLRKNNISVLNLAREMHFASANALSRNYKRHFGISITKALKSS